MNFHSRGWLHVHLPCGSLFCWLRQKAACLGSWGKMPSAGFAKKPPLLRGLFLYPHWCLLNEILFIGYILWVHPKVPEFPLEKCVLVKTSSLPQNLFRLLPYLRSHKEKNKTKWSFQTARNSHGTWAFLQEHVVCYNGTGIVHWVPLRPLRVFLFLTHLPSCRLCDPRDSVTAYLSRLFSLLTTYHWTHSHSEFLPGVSSPTSSLCTGGSLPETLLPPPTSSASLLLGVTSSEKVFLELWWQARSPVLCAPIALRTTCDAFVIVP